MERAARHLYPIGGTILKTTIYYMLELKDISFSVQDDKKSRLILDNLSLSFQPGELVVLTGPNGSGKSTLAEIIMGLKTPSKGQIILDGQDITKKNITERSRLGISYSFQQPVFFKGLTVHDLLQIAATGRGTFIEDEKTNYQKIFNTVGLEKSEYENREVNNSLSGGELKRIEIASVLAKKSKVMIFDEPEAGIDMWSFDNLTQVFKDIHKNSRDKIIIIISHQERIIDLANRTIILKKGRLC